MSQDLEQLRSLTIRPESLQYYLSRAGWQEVDFARRDMIRYEFAEDNRVFVLVPRNANTSDYREAVWRAVRTVSQIENRDYISVFKNMYSPNLDTLKLRFMGAGAEAGSLPLDYMRGAIDSIRDSLIFSACSEFSPQPMYGRQLADAIRLVGKSRFGQTQLGSFVVTIEMPVEAPLPTFAQTTTNEAPRVPIERRVLTRLIRGVDLARRVVAGTELIDPATEFRTGLNANLAESLAALKRQDGDFQIELSATWDRTIALPPGLPQAPLLIEDRTFEMLTSIGQALRGPAMARPVEARGIVIGLSREDIDIDGEEEDLDAERTISVKARIDEQNYKLRIVLSADDYRTACDAHRDRQQVIVRGLLEKSRKRWLLTNYQDFRLAP